jgi:predicted CoA-binding protein
MERLRFAVLCTSKIARTMENIRTIAVIGASEERNFQYQRIGALPPFII